MTEISEYAVLDGVLMPIAEASIPVSDDGFKRGDGVFEAFRVYSGRQFGLEEHMQRLLKSADGMMLREVDVNAVIEDVGKLIEAKGPTDYGVRVICTRGGHRVVMSEELHPYPPSISLATVEYQTTIVLDGLKTLSYGANVLANRIAEDRGHDEALLVAPDGSVLEGPTASIFWSPDGETLITPPLEHGILASITRQVLLGADLEIEVRSTTKDELLGATEAFLCSSVREVQAISQIDDVRLAVPGPLTSAAKVAYAAAVEARVAAPGAKTA